MELDDFKQAWQASTAAAEATAAPLDGARIRELLRTRSSSALAKLRRNLLIDAVSSLVGIPVLLYWSWQADVHIQALLGVAAVLAGGLSVALLYFRWQAGISLDPTLPLVEQLRSTVQVTERYLRIYERSLAALTMVALALGLGIGLILGAKAVQAVPQLPRPGWKFLLITSASFVAGYFITAGIYRITLRLFYGRHLDTLRACLAELEEVPAAPA